MSSMAAKWMNQRQLNDKIYLVEHRTKLKGIERINTILQKARFDYYVGYVLTCALPFVVPQISSRITEKIRMERQRSKI